MSATDLDTNFMLRKLETYLLELTHLNTGYTRTVDTKEIDAYLALIEKHLSTALVPDIDYLLIKDMAERIFHEPIFRDGSIRSRVISFAHFKLIKLLRAHVQGVEILNSLAASNGLLEAELEI
jgi:hypothetical protein